MNTKQINKFIQENYHNGSPWVSVELAKMGVKLKPNSIRQRHRRMVASKDRHLSPLEAVNADRISRQEKAIESDTKKKYDTLLSEVTSIEKELEAMRARSGDVFTIPAKVGSKDSEAVAVALWSDWHLEEEVKSGWVGGLNTYNLKIAQARSIQCSQNTVRLLKKEQQDSVIDTLILWLGGDFITGNIHDENVETAQLLPIDAMIFAETLLKSCIKHILDNTDVKLVIPCNAGNHSRITKKQRHSTDVGNSLETIMYHHLAEYFKDNKRVRFVLQTGYHVIVPVYDNFKIRFHHGQNIKFGGGVGGLYIPARKAIGQWQKSESVQLDCFGHLHSQKMDGDLFICNGSMIGYSPFAVAIKGDYEKPKQTLFLIDKKRGKTGFFPITFNI